MSFVGGLEIIGGTLMKRKDIFLDFVGKSPKSKILGTLLIGREEEYTLNDIIRATNVNRQKAYKILNDMVKKRIIIPSNKVKNIQFYKLSTDKDEVKLLIHLFDKLIGMRINK